MNKTTSYVTCRYAANLDVSTIAGKISNEKYQSNTVSKYIIRNKCMQASYPYTIFIYNVLGGIYSRKSLP